jgi:UDP-glucose 4-epimerase
VTWLIAGGAGYIGSHVVLRLLDSGFDVIVLDDLSTGKLERIPFGVKFIEGSILNSQLLKSLFLENKISGVIHLAGKKSVTESFAKSKDYFRTNVEGTSNLLEACQVAGVKYFIFSSTAAVFKDPKSEKTLDEHSPTFPTSPYGESKLLAEQAILKDSRNELRKIIFRFFNVTGSRNFELAETNAPNLVPVIQRAIAENVPVEVYGLDHKTPDGTCIRDYIHVLDVAEAHLAAIKLFSNPSGSNVEIINLGTGRGYSVLEVINSFEDLYKTKVRKIFLETRPGEPDSIVCNPSYAESLLGWKVTRHPFSDV